MLPIQRAEYINQFRKYSRAAEVLPTPTKRTPLRSLSKSDSGRVIHATASMISGATIQFSTKEIARWIHIVPVRWWLAKNEIHQKSGSRSRKRSRRRSHCTFARAGQIMTSKPIRMAKRNFNWRDTIEPSVLHTNRYSIPCRTFLERPCYAHFLQEEKLMLKLILISTEMWRRIYRVDTNEHTYDHGKKN